MGGREGGGDQFVNLLNEQYHTINFVVERGEYNNLDVTVMKKNGTLNHKVYRKLMGTAVTMHKN